MAHSYRHGDAVEYNWQPNDWNCPPDSASQELFQAKVRYVISEEELLYLVEKSLGLELAKFGEKSDLYKKYISNMTDDLEKLIKGQMKVSDFFDEYSFGSNLTAGNLGSMMQLLTDLIRLDLIE